MVTTEEKIAGIENLVEGFKDLDETYLVDRGNVRLDELMKQLKQENAIRTQ